MGMPYAAAYTAGRFDATVCCCAPLSYAFDRAGALDSGTHIIAVARRD